MSEMASHHILATEGITVSVISHGQVAFCEAVIADLARFAGASVRKLILTLNLPERPPTLPAGLPFEVEILRNPKVRGFAENHNKAFLLSSTRYFAVLNPDIRLSDNPFPALADSLKSPSVAIAAPRVFEADGRVADSYRRLVSPAQVLQRRLTALFSSIPALEVEGQPEWLAGMFLMFRASTFKALGGFDERYFLYCEDVDICARARLQGMQLAYVRAVNVVHHAQRASHRKLGFTLMHLRSLLRLWRSPSYKQYRRYLAGMSR